MIDESLQEGFIPLHIAAYNTITNINENNEKIINNEHEISKLINQGKHCPEIYREEPYDEDNLLFTIGKPPSGTCWIMRTRPGRLSAVSLTTFHSPTRGPSVDK